MVLKRLAGPQIAGVYGTRFRSTPMMFVNDDHDYFENDEANERYITFPAEAANVDWARATQHQFYPEFLPDPKTGRINGMFSRIDLVPVRYVNQGHSAAELFGIYRTSKIGLITPLRDGMNLVAKEYVAAQDPDDPGVLILSRFAGAAEQLTGALLVNPHSPEDIAHAIETALDMPLAERKARWSQMFGSVRTEDVNAWSDAFLSDLTGPVADGGGAIQQAS